MMRGTIPTSFTTLTNLNRFYIQENYLDRDNNHNALIPDSVNARFTRGGMVSHIYGQKDSTAPVISMTGTVPLIVAFFFNQQLTISENSYAINGSGVGMSVGFTGDSICANLNSSPITINSGTVSISIQSTYEGYFENCGLFVRDHAGNTSNVVMMPSFVLSLDVSALCDHPEMVIPVDECKALASIYTTTSGTNRTNDTNRFRTLNPEEWFGVRLGTYGTGLHVDGLFLHKSTGGDAYGSSITWNGNNIRGTLPNVFGQLPYLKDLNLTNNSIGGSLPDSL